MNRRKDYSYPAPERFDRQVSLLVVGDMWCGKTTLGVRFSSGVFASVPSTVHYDFHVRTVSTRDGRRVQVRVWDTAGQERFRAVAPVIYRGVHGVLLAYDCTRAATFANVRLWAEAVLSVTRAPVPCVLIGNKRDAAGAEREVAEEEGAALARDLGAARFFETSAKDGHNVDAAFLALVDAVLEPAQPEEVTGFPLDPHKEVEKARARACTC